MRVTIGSFDAGRRTIRGGCRSRDALEVVQRNHQKRDSNRKWGEKLRGLASHVFVWGSPGFFDGLEERPENRRKSELVVELRHQP